MRDAGCRSQGFCSRCRSRGRGKVAAGARRPGRWRGRGRGAGACTGPAAAVAAAVAAAMAGIGARWMLLALCLAVTVSPGRTGEQLHVCKEVPALGMAGGGRQPVIHHYDHPQIPHTSPGDKTESQSMGRLFPMGWRGQVGVGGPSGTGGGMSPIAGRDWPTSWGPGKGALLPGAWPVPEGLIGAPNRRHPGIVSKSLPLRHIGVSPNPC